MPGDGSDFRTGLRVCKKQNSAGWIDINGKCSESDNRRPSR
jgi:hypothetical protein